MLKRLLHRDIDQRLQSRLDMISGLFEDDAATSAVDTPGEPDADADGEFLQLHTEAPHELVAEAAAVSPAPAADPAEAPVADAEPAAPAQAPAAPAVERAAAKAKPAAPEGGPRDRLGRLVQEQSSPPPPGPGLLRRLRSTRAGGSAVAAGPVETDDEAPLRLTRRVSQHKGAMPEAPGAPAGRSEPALVLKLTPPRTAREVPASPGPGAKAPRPMPDRTSEDAVMASVRAAVAEGNRIRATEPPKPQPAADANAEPAPRQPAPTRPHAEAGSSPAATPKPADRAPKIRSGGILPIEGLAETIGVDFAPAVGFTPVVAIVTGGDRFVLRTARMVLEDVPGTGPRLSVAWFHSAPKPLPVSPGPDGTAQADEAAAALGLVVNALREDGFDGDIVAFAGLDPAAGEAVLARKIFGLVLAAADDLVGRGLEPDLTAEGQLPSPGPLMRAAFVEWSGGPRKSEDYAEAFARLTAAREPGRLASAPAVGREQVSSGQAS